MSEQSGGKAEFEKKLFPEEVVKYSPEMGELKQVALTTEPFQKRVTEGLTRVNRLHAESGFTIVSNGLEIVYPKLVLGGRDTDYQNGSDIIIGHGAKTSSVSGLSPDWVTSHYSNNTLGDYSVIGSFHFHPDFAAFSQGDIEAYDELQFEGYQQGLIANVKYAPDGLFGIFMPKKTGKNISNVTLFMFNGPFTSNEYQGTDFDMTGFINQQEALRASGMAVEVIDLPIIQKKVQFDPLKDKLK